MLVWINSFQTHPSEFLLLDRDGVVNVDRADYIKHWDEFRFYGDALDALRWLQGQDIGVIIISNQSALHRGLISWDDFWELHQRMVDGIREAGGDILATFYCPHRPDERCSCRKPSPEMILAASRLFSVSLGATYFIGDRTTDLLAASHAGCRGVLLDRHSNGDPTPAENDDLVTGGRYASLLEAVKELWKPA